MLKLKIQALINLTPRGFRQLALDVGAVVIMKAMSQKTSLAHGVARTTAVNLPTPTIAMFRRRPFMPGLI
jgi:hypothetical protein